ncbi:sulfate-transporting ATPase [Amycolatopsis bartoniae]|uniref:ABC transporter n=1 Tax=Amycolatopsis bartoniae TaxID=941986 RepID=A0A8H9MBM3_9PSEU|nr:ATP-binding cassette domain-containing protein [Amycolatopsis bartoniae]MBB2939689.1 sulfate-transporting ATPase [Amycolatopsis bartoniae]TVT06190.1 ATP-binding cassette domain-containing protein [Amycolatopsis bartoniae]GHF36481.1 ABC transporter [Amycolatopsis bartoniae]
MTTLLQFVILGLCTGALYALSALGMVIVYRGSQVINFAHAAIGVAGAYGFYELHDVRHLPFFAAFVPAILLCAVLGVLVQFGIMRPLQNSSPLVQILGTLGVLAVIQGALALRYKQQTIAVTSSLPRDPVTLGGISVGADRLLILLVVVVVAVLLAWLYARTPFGRATSAVAEDRTSAAYLGYSPNAIAGANWAVGSMLAGTAAILLAPITGLQTNQLTLLLVPALAAAVVGRLRSFPITVGAGLLIGAVQAVLGRYANAVDWGSAVPFVLVLVVLLLRGSRIPGRGHVELRLPAVGTGRIRPVTVIVLAVLAIVVLQVLPVGWVDGAITTVATGVMILSVVVVTGYGGQVSLAQVVLGGIGAWVAGRLVAAMGLGFGPALVLGVLAALPVGIIVGLPALRTRGANLAVITLAFGVAVEALLFNSAPLTGGDVGTQVGFISLFGIKLDTIFNPRNYATFCVVAFAVCGLAVANLRRGKAGRRLLAVRANERAAAAAGVNTTAAKLYAFSVGAMIASLGGILLAFRDSSIVYYNIQAFHSVDVLGYAVFGGVGYVAGPLVGGILQPGGFGTNIGNLFSPAVQDYLPIIGGALLILTLLTQQNGVVHLEARRWGRWLDAAGSWLRRRRTRPVVLPDEDPSVPRVQPKTLRTEELSVTFGSTTVLNGLSMEVAPGQVVGLIGPNGAGKTTAIDAITGFVQPSAGRVLLGEDDLTRQPPRRRAEAGLARSFQQLELFEDMTLFENLLVVSESRSWSSYVKDLFWPGTPKLSPAAAAAVRMFGLSEDLHRKPTELSYGRRRLAAIARAIAAEPSVILLDEPAAGLSQHESAELEHLLRYLADERGMGVLLIEHDVDLVMASCDTVTAIVFGTEIVSGTPEEVRRDATLIEAYLGRPVGVDVEMEDR